MKGETNTSIHVTKLIRLIRLSVVLLFAFIGSMIFFVFSLSFNSNPQPIETAVSTEVLDDADWDKIENGYTCEDRIDRF